MFPVPTINPQYITTWLPHYFSARDIQQKIRAEWDGGNTCLFLLVYGFLNTFSISHLVVLANHVCLCVGPALNTFQYFVFGWASSVSKPHVCLCVVRTGFEHLSVFGV